MRSVEDRWYSAYQAYNRARNSKWKEFWLNVMGELKKDFN